MKSRSREINVFSMSALDLFASALGAFILISIVLMPYFLRVDPDEANRLRRALQQAQAALAETRERLQRTQSELQQCETERDQAQSGLRECRTELQQAQSALEREQDALRQCEAERDACTERLSKTFLAVVIQWPTAQHDVDLHVIDAAREEFYYEKKTIPGRPGELSADTTKGPGVEIWEVAQAPAGRYQVLYNFFDDHDNSAAALVKGGVYHRDGHDRFRERRLIRQGRANALLVAVVTVNADGSVDVSEP